MLDAFRYLLCSKLCWHNRRMPNLIYTSEPRNVLLECIYLPPAACRINAMTVPLNRYWSICTAEYSDYSQYDINHQLPIIGLTDLVLFRPNAVAAVS